MKNFVRDINTMVCRIDRRHIQLAVLILSLSLFVLGAGAPDADGGVGLRVRAW
jgi:hypothetical protein